jgi:hypothetical protein
LNDENVDAITAILRVIFDNFLGNIWNAETQDLILERLVELGVLNPYREEGSLVDRTALVRIWKKLLETLGLLWVQNEAEIIITDVGLDLLSANEEQRRGIIEGQIVKYQYPNPSISGPYAESFGGLLPHVFLLQVLRECDYRIDAVEYELFVNLAQAQDEIDKVIQYIHSWRDIRGDEREEILERARQVMMPAEGENPGLGLELEEEGGPTRFTRIHLNSSYQKSFFVFPAYVSVDEGAIICRVPERVNELLDNVLPALKITKFRTIEDWFAYFGNPKAEPTWLTYLMALIQDAVTVADMEHAKSVVEEHKDLLTEEDAESVVKAQIEKDIETFYCKHPGLLEQGLVIAEHGRQYPTPIGRIDLLCMSDTGEYVVIEIKAEEARDSVFGQILRYIGWIHRNVRGARGRVRGIILAEKFPESARYSRIGLLKPDYQRFIQFKEHRLNAQDT